jgi:hypothetical protein
MVDLVALFDEYEQLLLISPVIVKFSIVKRRVLEREGYIRIRAELVDGGLVEMSEFWHEVNDETIQREYAYHWQDQAGRLVRRWDNVKHHLELPNAPHHVHLIGGQVEGVQPLPDLETVLKEIEGHLEINS